MKKIIFIISITLLAFNSQAQGTLQFNQVLTFVKDTSFNKSGGYSAVLTTEWDIYTVPANRVVKITKAINDITTISNSCETNRFNYTINETSTDDKLLEGSWLKEGDIIGVNIYLQTNSGSYPGTCTQNDNLFISLIEYNIIPE